MPRAAFVTGGSGFIGGRLTERLVADGWRVRALARSDASAGTVAERGAEVVRGDLSDVGALTDGARGCDVAFHCAAHLGDWGDPADFERGNVQGSANVVEACRRAGVRRMVHVGTEAAVLAGQPLVDADESAPLRPDSPALYSASKARAEALLLEADGDGLETVVIRPRFVWGRGDTTLLPRMVETVKSRRFAWIGGGRHRTSITHVDNVVQGLVLAADDATPGRPYFVTDGDPVVFREFVTDLLATQGVQAPDRSIPPGVARVVAGGGERLWRLLPLPGEPPLTRFAYWISALDTVLDDSRARADFGYAPVITREQGLAELAADGVPA